MTIAGDRRQREAESGTRRAVTIVPNSSASYGAMRVDAVDPAKHEKYSGGSSAGSPR